MINNSKIKYQEGKKKKKKKARIGVGVLNTLKIMKFGVKI